MADGFNVELDPELAERLRAAASAEGRSVEQYAADLLRDALDLGLEAPDADAEWAEAHQRLEAYERTGDGLELRAFLASLDADAGAPT